MKFVLKKGSQTISPLIEQCKRRIWNKARTAFYSKEKKHYVEETQKKIIVEIKITLK